jgi:tRNA nucleotidyltransferase (CCA-adding enzyme)
MTTQVLRYNLPEDSEQREIMAKNILDYSIAKKISKNIHDASIQKNETIRALKEKNGKKLEDWNRKAHE